MTSKHTISPGRDDDVWRDETGHIWVRKDQLVEAVNLNVDRLRTAADEVDRLRAVIENAPHEEPRDGDDGYGCQTNPCTCWKADAL